MLSDGCWRSLQHVLGKVDEDLVELSSSQQVKVFNNLLGVKTFYSHTLLLLIFL